VNPKGYAISTVAMDSSDGVGQHGVCRDHGIQHAGVSDIARLEDCECGRELDGLERNGRDGTAGRSGERVAGGSSHSGLVYAGTDVGVFVSSTGAPSWTEVGPAPGAGVSGFLPNAPVTALQIFNPVRARKRWWHRRTGGAFGTTRSSPDYTNEISNSPQTVFPTQTAVFERHADGAGRIRQSRKFELHGRGAGDLHVDPTQGNADGWLHA
jgi:hypothetical protein